MRFLSRLVIAAALLSLSATVAAQDTVPYQWAATGLSLSYPAAWNEPLPDTHDGQPVLELAQVLVETPPESRPPGIPMITLTAFSDAMPQDGNLLPFLYAALQGVGIDTPDVPADATFIGNDAALQLTGMSADGALFGIAQVAALNDTDVLVIVGRAVEAQHDDFLAIFQGVASSVTPAASVPGEAETEAAPVLSYGILWYTQRTQADGEDAFLNLVGLAYGPEARLYTYEADLGVVQVDAATGQVLSITPNDHITGPADLAVSTDGTVYVADTACGCIFTLTADGHWLDRSDSPDVEAPEFDPVTSPGLLTGFGEGAPAHLALGPDGALYATDVTDAGAMIVVVIEHQARSRAIALGEDQADQPVLGASPDGKVYALTSTGDLLDLTGSDPALVDTPAPDFSPVDALAITPDGNLVITSPTQGITIVTPGGEVVDQPGLLVPDSPSPGEMVAPHGVAVDPSGRLYVADSDGTFGAITAMSTGIPADRLGSANLTPDLAVQGILSKDVPQQTWTYSGTAGQRVTLTAIDNTGTGLLDVALHLLDPSGAEVAANDDHASADLANFTDAQIFDFALPGSGDYSVTVEAVNGEGTYSLGVTLTRVLTLDASGAASATGQLGPVFPTDVLEFSGSAEQTLNFTLEAADGDLDTVLRLIGPDGNLLAENDDADDSTLGSNSQLIGVSMPQDGTYQLEAARFDGSGGYRLTIASTP